VVTAPHSILRAPVTGESEEGNLMIIIKKKKVFYKNWRRVHPY
jgi:hypothetical protein